MSEHLQRTIADLQEELKKQEIAALDTKRLINLLCVRAGMPPMFADSQLQASSGPSLTIRPDQFYGQPLLTVLRQILEMRKAREQGPATINELYDTMVQGGYKFETKDEDNAKRGLRISITKNSSVFHRIPGGRIGLLEWYPKAKQPKQTKADDVSDLIGDVDEANDEEET